MCEFSDELEAPSPVGHNGGRPGWGPDLHIALEYFCVKNGNTPRGAGYSDPNNSLIAFHYGSTAKMKATTPAIMPKTPRKAAKPLPP